MNSGSHPHLRYIPQSGTDTAGAGILDRHYARHHVRDYTAAETLEVCAWLNDREAGYQATAGARVAPRRTAPVLAVV